MADVKKPLQPRTSGALRPAAGCCHGNCGRSSDECDGATGGQTVNFSPRSQRDLKKSQGKCPEVVFAFITLHFSFWGHLTFAGWAAFSFCPEESVMQQAGLIWRWRTGTNVFFSLENVSVMLCHAFHCKLVLRVEKPVQMQKVAWDQGEALVFQRLQMSKVYAALCSERQSDLFSYLKLAWWCLWSSGGKVPLLAKLLCFLSDLQWMRCKATSYHQQLWLKKKKKFIKFPESLHCWATQQSEVNLFFY